MPILVTWNAKRLIAFATKTVNLFYSVLSFLGIKSLSQLGVASYAIPPFLALLKKVFKILCPSDTF